MQKKYNTTKKYWLQLKENWFEDDSIKWLEEQENGVEYSNFYLKLMLKSIKTEGFLIRQVGEMLVPYDPKSLSKLTNTKVDTVIIATELLIKIGLIKILEDGAIYIEQVKRLTTTRTIGAEERRVRRLKQEARKALELKKETQKIDQLKQDFDNIQTVSGQMSGQMSDTIITTAKDIYIERDKARAYTHTHTHARESNEEESFSLSQKKFKKAFSNKKVDAEIPAEIDVDLLIKKINESEWLKMLPQPLSWHLKNYNDILADKYKTINPKNNSNKSKAKQHDYGKQNLDGLFADINEIEI